MFKTVLVALALAATPAFAQETAESVSATYSFTTPLAPGVACLTGDAVARIEAAAAYTREDNPEADAPTLYRLVREAVTEKVAQLSDSVVTFPDGTAARIDECRPLG